MPYRNHMVPFETTEEPEEFRLKKTVFLGYTDVNAGSIRALLGITMKREYSDVNIPELCNARIAVELLGILDPRDKPFSPLQVWNLKYEQFSVILVNTILKPETCHHVCSWIVVMCTSSCVDKIVVLSALRVDVPSSHVSSHLKRAPIYEKTINDMPRTKCPSLPGKSGMTDPFLSTLIQMVHVGCVPTCFLVVPAHRAWPGTARDEDGSKEVCEDLALVPRTYISQ
ncbi:uncharacterized protein LOC127842144 isoform X5 [Dreissena polymorpha]|uniref:uncharacterized protein LOC127842144 isoform X4 n=1 Tax=Dreissena polymorpha TaxID=45954 RepID=UPI0022649E42|nr:uncharacterized protein LOC127842144 isoform X4 [Dreissena polymorpha]XP_052227451.1 uncharacterized protein LOC127842144 isoform X5 [Dreissena polymorpha]